MVIRQGKEGVSGMGGHSGRDLQFCWAAAGPNRSKGPGLDTRGKGRSMGEVMRVDPFSYEELEASGCVAFRSSVKRASDRFQGKNDSGLSAA